MGFIIDGPAKLEKRKMVDPESKKTVLLVNGKLSKALLSKASTATKIGVNVFAIGKQGGGGSILPWYVGKTEKASLGKESLALDKLRKYATALERSEGGSPMLYFLIPEGGKDEHRVDALETFLIWLARQRNPMLLNVRKNLSPKQLGIILRTVIVYGLQEKKPGPTSATIAGFRRMIGWSKPVHIASYD